MSPKIRVTAAEFAQEDNKLRIAVDRLVSISERIQKEYPADDPLAKATHEVLKMTEQVKKHIYPRVLAHVNELLRAEEAKNEMMPVRWDIAGRAAARAKQQPEKANKDLHGDDPSKL